MTCSCGTHILKGRLVQTVIDHHIPFNIYHWSCHSCQELIEELRLGPHPEQKGSTILAYPVRSIPPTRLDAALEKP